jgi:predicted DNA-binding transcriptional regulator YafY
VRAERLLRIVLLLQSRGRVTAGDLARELEVSTRTIKRDMEALSGAGVPVYATRGGDGGWALLDRYRTSLTGLTASEVVSIAVGRPPGLLSHLGLDDPGEAPVLKLMEGVSPSAKQRVEHARRRVHVDLGSWSDQRQELLPVLQQAVFEDRAITMRYRASRSAFRVEPLGLVSKGGAWYLVARSDMGRRTYLVERIHDVTVTDEVFDRPDDFDLVDYWEQSGREYRETFPSYIAKLRVRGDALQRLSWTYARSKTWSEPDAHGWVNAELDLQDEDNALRTVRVLGNDVVIRWPGSLKRLALAEARAFVHGNLAR